MAVNTKDKYYTPDWLVEHTIKKAIEIIGKENIKEIVEPSAGDGAFIESLKKAFPDLKQRYYDLYPEHPEVIEQNYKEVRLTYKKGRLTIGNPPFGASSSLWKAFCRKAATNSDYIVYISPASQYKSNYYFKEGELIYSELLNDVEYRGSETEGGKATKVRTCLNIYKVYDREGSEDWRLQRLEQDVKIFPALKDEEIEADFYLRRWANGGGYGAGEYDPERKYAMHIAIKVLNENVRDKVKDFCENFYKLYGSEIQSKSVGIPTISKDKIKEYLIKHLYPTREERLEQDVLIKIALFRNNEWRDKHILNEEYDLYVNTSYHINYIETCDFTKLTSNALVVKILNSTIKEKALTLIKKYIDDKHYVSEKSGYMSGFTVAMLKEYLISHLYPTREERLEQDVLIDRSNKFDYCVGRRGNGYYGKLLNENNGDNFSITILNENIRKNLEYILKYLRTDLSNKLGETEGTPTITLPFLKEYLIKALYDDDPTFDSYDVYPEVKKPIKIERAHHAKPLFEESYIEEIVKAPVDSSTMKAVALF